MKVLGHPRLDPQLSVVFLLLNPLSLVLDPLFWVLCSGSFVLGALSGSSLLCPGSSGLGPRLLIL